MVDRWSVDCESMNESKGFPLTRADLQLYQITCAVFIYASPFATLRN